MCLLGGGGRGAPLDPPHRNMCPSLPKAAKSWLGSGGVRLGALACVQADARSESALALAVRPSYDCRLYRLVLHGGITRMRTLQGSILLVSVFLLNCGEDDLVPGKTCEAGATQECMGRGACHGAQICAENGAKWGPCECSNDAQLGEGGDSGDRGEPEGGDYGEGGEGSVLDDLLEGGGEGGEGLSLAEILGLGGSNNDPSSGQGGSGDTSSQSGDTGGQGQENPSGGASTGGEPPAEGATGGSAGSTSTPAEGGTGGTEPVSGGTTTDPGGSGGTAGDTGGTSEVSGGTGPVTGGTTGVTGGGGSGGTESGGTGGEAPPDPEALSFVEGVISAASNPFGIQGPAFTFQDGYSLVEPPCGGYECYEGITGTGEICMYGELAQVECDYPGEYDTCYWDDYWGAGVGIDLNQIGEEDPLPFAALDQGITGFRFTFTNYGNSDVRFNLKLIGDDTSYCVLLAGDDQYTIRLGEVLEECWDSGGARLSDTQLNNLQAVQWVVPANADDTTPFDFCISDVVPLTD